MTNPEGNPPGNPTTRLPPQEFNQRYEFLQQDVNLKSKMGTLPDSDTPSPELMDFINERLKSTPIAVLTRFAQIKNIPICNYYCYEVPETKLYVCVMEYEINQYYGAKKKNKKDAKNSAALKLLDFLYHSKDLLILDKKYAKTKEKELPPSQETKQIYENANPTPIVNCPSDFTNLREHIWMKFEKEGLPDPVFSPDTLTLFDSVDSQGSSILNQHCNLNKIKSPDIVVFVAPTERNGKKYIGATVFNEKVFLGAISKSKAHAKNNCAASIVDFLIKIGKFNPSRRQKRKMESISGDEMFTKEGKLNRLHDLDEQTLKLLSTEKTPMTLLNEICAKFKLPKTTFQVSSVEEGSFLFVSKAVFENAEFTSVPAPRKKDANNNAAVLVIDYLFRNRRIQLDDQQMAKIQKSKVVNSVNSGGFRFENCYEMKGVKMEVDGSPDGKQIQTGPCSLFDLAQSMVYNAVKEAYNSEQLMVYSSRHISGIICHNSNSNQATLVSWATGNTFNSAVSDGALKDCYAEVLARRGFLIYLLNQVEEYISSNGTNSIFTLNDETKLLRVKDEFTFHLFMSDAPIGDGCRVPHDETDFSNAIFPITECYVGHGFGQLAVKKDGKDLIEPLMNPLNSGSMASSDKILKWNVCGIQGAALFHLMEPIYFASIIVENNFDRKNLTRALYGRAKLTTELKKPFKLQKPMIIFFPIIDWLPKYDVKNYLFFDIIAGVTAGVIHVTQGVAYAILCGIPPVNGLYMSLLAPLVYMFFGTSRTTSLGSFAIISLMVADANKKIMQNHYPMNYSEIFEMEDNSHFEINPSTICSTLTFTVGLLQLLAAILKFEYFTTYFSDPLVGGFTTAAAIHVFFTQVFDILGVKVDRKSGPFYLFGLGYKFFQVLPQTNPVTLGTSVVSALILIFGKDYVSPVIKKLTKNRLIVPFELVVMILGTLISYIFDFRHNHEVAVVGEVPTDLPRPLFPVFSIVPECLSYALPITVLTVAIHVSMSKVLAQRQNYQIDPGQEIYAISFASLISSFFPVFPNSNGFGRSFVQADCGARTQICSLASSLFLLGVILFMGPLFTTLPRCVLSTVIILSMRSILRNLGEVKNLWTVSKIDFSIWMVSCLASVIIDVINGLVIAVAFALLTVVLRTQR